VPGLGRLTRGERRRRQASTSSPATPKPRPLEEAPSQKGVAAAVARVEAAPKPGPGVPLAFSPELLADLGDLAPALQPLMAALAVERPPAPQPDRDVAHEVAKLLAEERPCATAGQVSTLEAEIAGIRGALINVAGQPKLEEVLQQSLDDLLAKLAKTSRHAPSAGTEILGLERAATSHELARRERADRHAAGAAKARERGKLRSTMASDLRALITRAEQEVGVLEAQLSADHEAADKARAAFDVKVAEAIAEKIRMAKQQAASPPPPVAVPSPQGGGSAGSAPNGPAPGTALVATPAASLDEIIKEKLIMEAKLKAQLKDLQDALAAQQARDPARDQALAVYDKVQQGVSIDDLPVLVAQDLSDTQLRACGLTWWMLARWAGAGATSFFTVGEVARELGMAVEVIEAVFKLVIGSQQALWPGGPHEVIPRQSCLLVQESLSRLKGAYESGLEVASVQQQAKAAFAAIESLSKKRRVGP